MKLILNPNPRAMTNQPMNMNATELTTRLKEMNACDTAMEWQEGKSLEEVWNTCHRGDWMLWLLRKSEPQDNRILYLVAGHCANTVRHLMKDERSIAGVDAAIAYGEGRIDINQIRTAAAAAAAAYAAVAYAAAAADAAAYAAADAAAADAAAAYAAAAYAAAAYAAAAAADAAAAYAAAAYAAARNKSRQATAEIVRQHVSLEMIANFLSVPA